MRYDWASALLVELLRSLLLAIRRRLVAGWLRQILGIGEIEEGRWLLSTNIEY
jgi:hypothetical protein